MSFSQGCVTGAVRTLNAGGRALRRFGMNPPALDADSLRRAAMRRAASNDFGDWPFDEPLTRLLDSYQREADLTMLGRLAVRELIVSLLENLLRLEAERSRDRQIETQDIVAPVFIVGLPRTGTTLLHGLMSEDPANRVPRTWEVMYPAARTTTAADLNRARARTTSRLAWANRLAPEFKRIHPIAPDLPQECIAITAQVFMSIQFHTTHDVRSYEDWLERDSQRLGYDFHYRFLQHLQAKRPGKRWVLKAPGHLFALEALLTRYPDAKVIQTHRDPLRVMASMASHATVLRRAFSDSAEPRQIAADWAERWGRALDNFLAVRDRSPSAHFLDLSYEAIESASLETIERVYDFLGWPLTAEARRAMVEFLAANPKNKHGAHKYSLAQYGLDREVELRRFRRYCERFAIAVQAEG
ncbi:MAG TPA: sulfotransferase [Gammaproteobacteria bacterium]|nr:sulfotransferase [Gammaproteobacteria bacterium]